MASIPLRSHVVRPGESLSKIAAQYGFRDWKTVYGAPCNAQLRLRRPNPNELRPGDVIMIPPKPEDVARSLQERLNHLEQLRRESATVFDGLERELDQEYAKLMRVSKGADAGAEVSLILVSLGSLVHKGFQSLKLTGDALERANKEIAKSAVADAYMPVVEKSAEAWADNIKPDDGRAWAFGKIVVKAWFDMQTPSFWAGVVASKQEGRSWSEAVTRRPEDWLKESKAKISAQRQQTLGALDRKITETRSAVRAAVPGSGQALP